MGNGVSNEGMGLRGSHLSYKRRSLLYVDIEREQCREGDLTVTEWKVVSQIQMRQGRIRRNSLMEGY